jgi:hypothetical protein
MLVIAGLNPAIHEAFQHRMALRKSFAHRTASWMRGSSPRMTPE